MVCLAFEPGTVRMEGKDESTEFVPYFMTGPPIVALPR